MSLFTDASLVLIPSGIKDQKVYSITPIDGSGDLTFSRGSDIEATRIGSDGLIQKAQVNLLLQSNSFNTTWVPSNVSVTGGQAGYDGSSDAWLIDITGGTSSQRVNQTISASGVLTLSVYAKAGTLNWISVRGDAPAVSEAYFNLATGTLGSLVGAAIDSSIESVGSGWYRCSVSFVDTTVVRIYLASGDGNLNQSSGNVYLQDAQLNYGLVAQTYQETTTAAVVSGITNDMPRLSYDPANPTCPSLLLEPSRQNLFPQSEFFGGSDWLKANLTTEDNVVISPEGVQNASRIIETAINASHQIYDGFSATSGQAYTLSFFAKENGRDIGVGMASGIFGSNSTYFDLTNGVVLSTNSESATIEDYGNGWFRCSVTNTANSSGSPLVYIILSNNENFNYLGDGTSGVYLYGAQVEAGSYPTSYIPTYGSSATRTADAASKTGISSLIGQTEGTLFAVINSQQQGASYNWLNLSDNSTSNWVFIGKDGLKWRNYIRANGSVIFDNISTTINNNTDTKIALAYKSGEIALYINGTQIATSASAFSFTGTLSKLSIGDISAAVGESAKYGQVLVFTSRLSNADLATLTSL